MKNKFLLAILALSFGLFSCEKDKLEQGESNTITEEQPHNVSDGIVVLGEKINDPYAICNMKAAYSNLKSAGEDTPVEEIQPNKKYLRFLPKDEAEWDLLKSDTSLVLYDFPLDYEIAVYGTYYHDPELPDSSVTWQYCVVPIDKEVPNIQHELLYEVFIPSFDSLELDTTFKSASITTNFFEQLVYESYKLTGNVKETDDNLKSTKGIFKPKRWHPSGRITVQDDLLGSIPLEGANVHARWATHMEDCNTNSKGEFSMGGFIYEVNYSIKWDRYEYSIRSGTAGQAWYNGPKQKGAWNLHISSGASIFYATIHRAAFHYYYGNTGGIKRPPQNSGLDAQMKIAAMNESNDDINGQHAAWKRVLGILNWIKIWNPQHDDDDIYGTVIHELAHASHWDMGHGDFNDTETIVKESWARGVQRVLTRMVYSSYNPSYARVNYTGIVIDMIDGFGTKGTSSWWDNDKDDWGYPASYKSYNDQVSGYTLKQIEDALKGQKNWSGWKDNIKNKYTNGTENNLDAAFTYWNTK